MSWTTYSCTLFRRIKGVRIVHIKTVLVVTNSKRKSLVFVSNELDTYSLEEAVQLTRERKLDGAHIVKNGKNTYIRTNPGVDKSEEFDSLSITVGNLLLYAQDIQITKTSPLLNGFIMIYRAHLKKNEQLIKPVGQPEVLIISVKGKLQQNKNNIFEAAKEFNIDPYLLGAILIDEIARLAPFESIGEKLGVLIVGRNTSVGIAQVKTDTANSIIKLGLYNPNPKDPKLPFKRLDGTARAHLYTYLIEPKHNIFFAGANIRLIINFWATKTDLTKRPEIIATLYPQGLGEPKINPKPDSRGEQIAGEFYDFAKEILN